MTYQKPEIQPKTVVCPNCNAGPGEPCTQPTDTGRRNVMFFHHARVDLLVAAAQDKNRNQK